MDDIDVSLPNKKVYNWISHLKFPNKLPRDG